MIGRRITASDRRLTFLRPLLGSISRHFLFRLSAILLLMIMLGSVAQAFECPEGQLIVYVNDEDGPDALRTVIYDDKANLIYTDHQGTTVLPTASGGIGIINRVARQPDGEYFAYRILNLPGYEPDQVLLLGSTPFWPTCEPEG